MVMIVSSVSVMQKTPLSKEYTTFHLDTTAMDESQQCQRSTGAKESSNRKLIWTNTIASHVYEWSEHPVAIIGTKMRTVVR